jgi:dipeptidyl aminopeptidase/acylaminoacyl peptidase
MKKIFALLTLLSAPLFAQKADSTFDFSIKNIMRGPELYGRRPENVRWSVDGKWIFFTWVEAGKPWHEKPAQFRIRATPGAVPERLTPQQLDSVGPLMTPGSRSLDGGLTAVSFQGDLFIIDNKDATVRRLTRTNEQETKPVFSANSRLVYFVRDNNVYAIETLSGMITQITDIRLGDPPTDSTKSRTKQRERLATQQRDLFQTIRDKLRSDSIEQANQQAMNALLPKPIYVGKDVEIESIDISPNGKSALITLASNKKPEGTVIPFFVTETGYTESRSFRSKVGDIDTRYSVLFVTLPEAKQTRLKLFPSDSLANYIEFIGWNPSGTHAAFYAFRPDNKVRMLYTVSATGALSLVEQLRDTAWIDGPCVTCAGWYDQGKRLWYVSEATGFAHLYTTDTAGTDRKQLTSGRWEVRKVTLAPDERDFYIIANEISPFEEQLYRLPVTGGKLTRITTRSGDHDVAISPDGTLLADVHSYVNVPPDLYLMANIPNAEPVQLTHSPSEEWKLGKWIVPELVKIPASDGAQVPAHLYHPKDMGAEPNGAAVIFVHGAGYLHNVGNFWSKYPREYMFNQFLAKHGYIVLDLDYRASDGYGRDWRTAIYRWMGGRDLQDHVDASKYLTKEYNIPPNRIGIYGGSYGGFITLMALFTTPDYFGAGAALRAVTDWAHYNQGYTSNILNLPQNDTLAYRRSSPIYFAEGLRAPLLMTHGMVDVNVHYQDIIRLTQRLIELGKTDWELASYPVEDHAFLRPSSWTDQYTRIFKLFERTIRPPTPQ